MDIDATDMNECNDNSLYGTMVKRHESLFYLLILELEHVLTSWTLDGSLEKKFKTKTSISKNTSYNF